MSGEENTGRRKSAREEFEEARERYTQMRQQERDVRQQERDRERAARHEERVQFREQRRSLRDEVRSAAHVGIGRTLGEHIGRTIKESMSFSLDLGDPDASGEEYSEIVERDFAVGPRPGLRVRNVSGDTKISVGTDGAIHVKARKRVRGTSEERAKRLLENVEVRMEQEGNDVLLKPHLYEQDRGWADLFRGGRVAVDFEIRVPREVRIEAHTVSGDLTLAGTRGPVEAQSVSGELDLNDIQGPLRLKTVSGDGELAEFAGQLAANTVSGDLTFDKVRLHGSDIVTVSGDVRIDGELAADREHRMKTISGDVELRLTGGSYDVRFTTMSGDLESEMKGDISGEGRRAKRIVIGKAETQVSVKTMSGDLEIRASDGTAPQSSAAATTDLPPDASERPEWSSDPERTERMDAAPAAAPRADIRDLLERVARGEVDVDAAAAALDDRRGP